MANAPGIRAGRAYVELGVSDKLTAGLKRAQAQLKTFASGTRALGLGLTGISAALAAPTAVAVKTFADFEQQMARVKALTGASQEQFQQLTAEARRLGEKTVFSASQAAQAMSFFALAGYKVEQILAAIGPTLDMAAAGQIDIASAADIAAKIMAGMGIEADHLGQAVDVLTLAMTTANTDLRQLGEAMKFVGPVAKSAGLSFEEIVGAIQMLSNAGIQAEMAGTTLRGALLSLTDPSKEAADQLAKMGVRVSDARGNVRHLADIIDDMNQALAGLGTGQKLAIIGRIFDARQAAGFAELLAQGGNRLRTFTAALRQAQGTAGRIAGIQLDTLQGDAVILTSAFEELQIALGKQLGPMLRTVTRAITEITLAIAHWLEQNSDLVRSIALAAVGVGAVGAGLLAISLSATVAAKAFGGLALITGTAVKALGLVAGALGALFSPLGLVIAAVAGLGTALVVSSGAAGDALSWLAGQFRALRDTVAQVMTGMTHALAAGDVGLAARILWLSLKLAWQEGVAALNSVWLEAKRFFIGVAQKMWYGALATAEEVFHALEVAWIETTAFLSTTWTHFTSGFQKAWNTAINWTTKRLLELQSLFDDSFDVEAAKRMADEDLAATNAEIEQQRQAAIKAREQRRQDERAQAAKLNEAALAEIGKQFEEAQQALDTETDAKLAGTRQALTEARRQLDEALAAAKTERENADRAGGPPTRKPADPLAGLEDRLAGLGELMAGKISVVGTFNAVAAGGLATGHDAAERTARASEQTARNTKRLVEAAANGGLRFT